MAEVQIKKMHISHEMILNWLVMNPEKTQNECAEVFGVTPAWLSVVVNSDCFQARWMHRRQMLATGVVALAEAKMRGVVDKGLDRLEKLVDASENPQFVLETTDKLLGRLGYGPKTGPAIQVNTQNNYAISRDVLEQARKVITDGGPGRELEVLQDLEVLPAAGVETPAVKGLPDPDPDPAEAFYPQNPFKDTKPVDKKLVVPLPPRRFE